MLSHPLDNPVWNALTGPHVRFATGAGTVRRYRPDVAPFAAAESGLAELASALASGDVAVVFAAPPDIPAGIDIIDPIAATQMIAEDFLPVASALELRPLGDSDVPQMQALTDLTHPGPFRSRTIEMGHYLGVFDGSQLVAMAGRRMHLPGFVEISAVCTHPAYQGRGYAKALVSAVGRQIIADGEIPFLHVRSTNSVAIGAYRSLGFKTRRELTITFTRKP